MKTCFVSRLGGAGDIMHCAHLPELIKKHYEVTHLVWETNYHGMHILSGNPFIDDLQMVDTSKMTFNRMFKNLEHARETYDLVFDLSNTIEKAYCTNENDQRYYRSDKWRRENLGTKSYYDVMIDAVGLPESYYGTRGKLYFSDYEHEQAKQSIENRKKELDCDTAILINLSGSTLHKKFIQAESIARKLLDKYPKAYIVLTGDEHCQSQVFEHERVLNRVGVWNFRTVALRCKYMDLNISLESGLALIAHSWDAPTIQLLTAASWDNHVKYAKNAYWLQAETACSPCHRNPREYFGCPVIDQHPACIFFNEDKIMSKVEEAIAANLSTV